VGGAERARRDARKRKYQPRPQSSLHYNNPSFANNKRRHDTEHYITPYPKSMREYDRFFGSLLSSSTVAIQKSETDVSSHRAVIQLACSLLNVPCPHTSSYPQQNTESIDARNHHLMQRSSSLLSNVSESMYSSSGSYDNARGENLL
jgi:hypothetical protein